MFITVFTDLPDLVILNIFHYLSPFDAIQGFYSIDNNTDRIINLLIEARCFSVLHHLRLPLFNFVCDSVLPRMGTKLSHLTLYDHQLALARDKQILSYLPNLSSLHLINIIEIIETNNHLSYFLHKQLQSLTIDFISEHHIEAQAYLCEQFIFHNHSESLTKCHLFNPYGLQLQHLTLFPNYSIERMTIQLKQLSDLHVLFDHLVNIRVLNVKLCQWTIEDIEYDYTKLPKKLPYLNEFSLETEHTLSFNQLITIIQHLIHLNKLSFNYRNYDERGIDINRLELALHQLHHLLQLHFIIKFIYFNLDQKLTFDNNLQFKQQWNVCTYCNSIYKNYLAYTRPLITKSYSISTDILLEDDSIDFPSVTNLTLTTHKKQRSLVPMIRLLTKKFPSVTHLRFVDSFGVEENENSDFRFLQIRSFDASELKISKLFRLLLQTLPNLVHLHVNVNILIVCDLQSLLFKTKIKQLELITNNLEQINEILPYFSTIEQLIINSKKQSSQYKRKPCRIVLNWFDICPRLYTIHVKVEKLSDLFYIVPFDSDETMNIHCQKEMLTVWK